MTVDPVLVKNALSAHSCLGLLVGAMMYVICLSGALLVFHDQLERWEQPYVSEFDHIDVEGMEQTLNTFLAKGEGVTPHMYLVLPTPESPRARLANEVESWFLNADGSVAQAENNGWSEMLLNLHLYLHLPESWGMVLVSATGTILVGLLVSGFFAHPKVFRDAFNLRIGGSKQLEQTDLHNRLSVWGAPFYLMIAITGAYFGLAIPNLSLYAQSAYDGDEDKVVSMVFGEEPQLNQPVGRVEIGQALDQVAQLAPNAVPILIVLHDAGESNQHLSISAFHPGRLIYSENYLFDTRGNYLRSDGFVDGPAGKQVVYSIYRLHFGTFAGILTKWVYAMLGLGLAVVSVTGINVWLVRRRITDQLNDLWVGIVWGVPLALATSAGIKFLFLVSPLITVWITVLLSCLFSVGLQNPLVARRALQVAFSLSMMALVLIHVSSFRDHALSGAAGIINGILLVAGASGIFVVWWIWRQNEQTVQQSSMTTPDAASLARE